MNSLLKTLRPNALCLKCTRFFNATPCLKDAPRPVLRKQVTVVKRIEPFGWFMLIIPVSTFGLGVWQIQRKAWKENLISELQERTNSLPRALPENLDEAKNLEFYPVHVRGTFLHDKEMYIGPRSKREDTPNVRTSFGESPKNGYLVVTPFKLENREETILINRGWVPSKQRKATTRPDGQVEGTVDVIGILRLNENRPNFSMKNKEGTDLYFYRDLSSMCAATGASPIFLDQTVDFNAPNGPIGGQTRVTLRNEHLSYIITWFSLSLATSYMWYTKFIPKF